MLSETLKELFRAVHSVKSQYQLRLEESESLIKNESVQLRHPFIANVSFYVGSVANFVPAFRIKYVGQKPYYRESLATFDDVDPKTGDPIKVPLGPVGFKYNTHILSLTIDRNYAEEKIGNYLESQNLETEDTESKKLVMENLIKALTTLSFCLRKTAGILQACDIDDVLTSWTLHKEHCYLFLFDNVDGGNGITYSIYSELRDTVQKTNDFSKTKLFKQMSEILKQECCHDVCEECLLLPRTPQLIMKMLDKKVGRTLLVGE